jgi:hypothetical protein
VTFTLFAISHAVHQVAVRLDPQEVKCGLKNESDPAIPCGNVLSFALRLFSGKVQYLAIFLTFQGSVLADLDHFEPFYLSLA